MSKRSKLQAKRVGSRLSFQLFDGCPGPGVDLYFGQYDTYLPQIDQRPEHGNEERKRKRALNDYIKMTSGLPVQVLV